MRETERRFRELRPEPAPARKKPRGTGRRKALESAEA
jgi:hypothetical protein